MRNNTIQKLSAMAGLAVLLLAGCQKDNTLLRIRLDHFAGDGKVYMDNITPKFEDGDAVCVNNKIDNAPTVSMTAGSSVGTMVVETDPDGYRAVYPDEYVTAVNGDEFLLNIPRVQEYSTVSVGGTTKQQVKAPMGGVNEGTELEFHNLGAMLAVVLVNDFIEDGVLIDSIQVTASNASLWGPAEVSDITSDERAFTCTQRGSKYNTVSLAGANNTSLNITLSYHEACTLYVYVPMVSDEFDNRYTVTTFSHDATFNSRHTRTQQNPYSGCIQLNRIAMVEFPFSRSTHINIPNSIDGLYSIGVVTKDSTVDGNKTKKFVTDTIKVDFSTKGNLQALVDATGQPIYWQFANHQWDLIENHKTTDTVDANTTIGTGAGWVDLFGHSIGTPGTNPTSTNNFGIYTSTSSNNYSGTFVDWGSIPGVIATEGEGWFTLSADQWGFMLGYSENNNVGQRLNHNMLFFGGNNSDLAERVMVNGVPGIIFLPDTWDWGGSLGALLPTNSTIPTVTYTTLDGKSKSAKSYTLEQWEIMEMAGAIFMPTGRERSGNSYTQIAEGGLYATSDADNPGHPIHNHNHGSTGPQYGFSVRLACNIVYKHLDTPVEYQAPK